MALKTFKPYTKSTRGTVVLDKSTLWKGSSYKPLTKGQNFTGGRNNNGRITSRHIGGGSKHKYRVIDFYRKKFGENIIIKNFEKQKSFLAKKLSSSLSLDNQVERVIDSLEEKNLWQKFGL